MLGVPKKLNRNQIQITLTKLTGLPDAYKSPKGMGFLLCHIQMIPDKLLQSLLQLAPNVTALSKKVQAFITGHLTERFIV
jgi:hypothetical protein